MFADKLKLSNDLRASAIVTIGWSFSRRRQRKRRIRRSSTCLKPCGKNLVRRKRRSSANWRQTVRGLWILMPHLPRSTPSLVTRHPSLLLGTAFSFVHLLDFLAERNLRFDLPAGSRVMETGGYKNRSRSMPKTELHQLITERLGVPPSHIICEYGMSELSSQAYAA
jgi:hypothetical protein